MTDKLTPEELAAIQARHAAATPGPWVADVNLYGAGKKVCCRQGQLPSGDVLAEVMELNAGITSEQAMNNAMMIAHSRTDIPALISHAAALEAEIAVTNKRLADALAVLRTLEWNKSGQSNYCPSCGGREYVSGHTDDCALAAVLKGTNNG